LGLNKLIKMRVMQTFVVFSGKSVYLEILQRLCVHRAEKGYMLGRIFLAELHLRISEQDRSSSTTRRRRYVNHDTMLKDQD